MNYLGDFSRLTFNPTYSRVLLQQGRALLDADWNEQSAIHWHYLRRLAVELGGPYWRPRGHDGFAIEPDGPSFKIARGSYYVWGLRCRNAPGGGLAYHDQPGFPFPDSAELEAGKSYLVYLEVWERHISYIEDDTIREVALGGPDTTVRAQIVWQVKAREFSGTVDRRDDSSFRKALAEAGIVGRAPHLTARAGDASAPGDEPCVMSPEARYRGAENQLYRVEVHRGGVAAKATFKWCRDNSVNFPIERREGRIVTLEHLGRDARLGLAVGDWVELLDDHQVLRAQADPLLQVEAIDAARRQVSLSAEPGSAVAVDPGLHPQLRRWDQKAGTPEEGGVELDDHGTIPVVESDGAKDAFIGLEDGIQVEFFGGTSQKARYRTGDYWLIPARTATGDVLWPSKNEEPLSVVPHGIRRSYAPLALVEVEENGHLKRQADLRRKLIQTWE